MPGMTSAPRKGRRDFEPANGLNETGADCARFWAQGLRSDGQQKSGRLRSRKLQVLGPPGPLLTNRMAELVTYGSVGGGGSKPAPYPALDAAGARCLHFVHDWRGAIEHGDWPSPPEVCPRIARINTNPVMGVPHS